jgi:hypothetical protein
VLGGMLVRAVLLVRGTFLRHGRRAHGGGDQHRHEEHDYSSDWFSLHMPETLPHSLKSVLGARVPSRSLLVVTAAFPC